MQYWGCEGCSCGFTRMMPQESVCSCSEFLYLQNQDYPTEEEQFKAYKTVAEMMAGKKVIIRTLDIGADKKVDYFHLDEEDNPALGYRAIRICLTRPEIFRTQLRALLRASAFGNIAIMLPMITSLWEVQKAKEIIADVKKELTEQGISYKDVEVGVMIETPAAVMIADDLAKEVDFFSIGTRSDPVYHGNRPARTSIWTPSIMPIIRSTAYDRHGGGKCSQGRHLGRNLW